MKVAVEPWGPFFGAWSVISRSVSADPDPGQNEPDPQHCLCHNKVTSINLKTT